MKFGIQTYGPRPLWQPDPEAYFREIYRMGYRQLEPCVAVPGSEETSAMGFWSPEELAEYCETLEKIGLDVVSVHVFTQDLASALPELLRLAGTCGITQVVLPCPQEIEEKVYLAYAEICKACARELQKEGARLLFHNNGGEIRGKLGGKTAYEFLLDACEGLAGAQPDLGWLAAGGEDPEAFLWRNEERVWSLHYKDEAMGETPKEAPLGQGDLDLMACFQFARAHGIPQIVDMDSCTLEEIEQAAGLLKSFAGRRERTSSALCVLDTDTGEIRELRRFEGVVEAPNWLADGNTILYNADGRIFRYLLREDRVEQIDTGECDNCNNDHVPSPDGRLLGVSHMGFTEQGFTSRVYIVDPADGSARIVTENSPSFLHGWSPDGKELAYCAFRDGEDGRQAVDVYAVSAEGGNERRLTDGVGYNDGPEYSPDGKHIWFNSTRSGPMQVWRMDRDGGGLVQMTRREDNCWFPHVSPDGKRVLYLVFRKGELDPGEHLPNMRVRLCLMDADGGHDRELAEIFGGQGSVNVNSWAPDSRRAAVVLYTLEHK